jgi:hypothetical protein
MIEYLKRKMKFFGCCVQGVVKEDRVEQKVSSIRHFLVTPLLDKFVLLDFSTHTVK